MFQGVPAGVEEGMALGIPGHGLPSEEAGSEAGDLYVILPEKPGKEEKELYKQLQALVGGKQKRRR